MMKQLFSFLLSLLCLSECEGQQAVSGFAGTIKPLAVVNGQNTGICYLNDLFRSHKIDIVLKDSNSGKGFTIQNYSVAVLMQGDSVFVKKNNDGSSFPDELKQEFKKTGHGSKLIFYEINALGSDGLITELSPIECTITKK